jgi:hypothetical protein
MTRLEQLKEDVKTHGILFNFKDKGELKTGIVRKGAEIPSSILDGSFVPMYRKMTRKERRTL